MTGDLTDDRSISRDGADATEQVAWTPAERALLDAALEFYAASAAVIDYAAPERPQLRQDAAGFDAVRRAMALLEQHVRAARDAGVAPERIAEIARIEPEMVGLILRRDGAAPSSCES